MTSDSSKTLLERLRDPDDGDAWKDFCERYRPVILAYTRRQRLQPADADNIVQEVIKAFVTAWRNGRFNSDKGRLRHWLARVARNKIADLHEKKARQERQAPDGSSTGILEREVDSRRQGFELIWEQEWENFCFRRFVEEASKRHDRKTICAFEQYALKGRPAREVAERLGITVNAVYMAKKRLYELYREVRKKLEEGR